MTDTTNTPDSGNDPSRVSATLVTQSLVNFDVFQNVEDQLAEKLGPIVRTEAAKELVGLVALRDFIQHNRTKEKYLLSQGDTAFSNTLGYYLSVAIRLGFEIVAAFPFTRKPYTPRDEERHDTFYVLVDRTNAIVLAFDTYTWKGEDGKTQVDINGGKFYYAWKPNRSQEDGFPTGVLSSGGWESPSDKDWRRNRKDLGYPKDGFWFGNHDCREALVFHINQLKEHGTFITPWPNNGSCQPFRAFVTESDYTELKDDSVLDLRDRTKRVGERHLERAKALPQWFHDLTGNSFFYD